MAVDRDSQNERDLEDGRQRAKLVSATLTPLIAFGKLPEPEVPLAFYIPVADIPLLAFPKAERASRIAGQHRCHLSERHYSGIAHEIQQDRLRRLRHLRDQ